MDSKISSTKLACIVAYLLFACFFQLLTANEEVKLNDELKVMQLPEANSEALDGVFQRQRAPHLNATLRQLRTKTLQKKSYIHYLHSP
uniref:Uncharacterized protein n=1 Tax=Solanum tuberosum TaxID=4113 RepID=M1AFY7_SOLTU